MKKRLAWLAIALPMLAQAGWVDPQGRPLPDTPSMRSSGDFGVQLLLTDDEKAFRHTWNTSRQTPQLKTTNKISAGQEISGVLIFSGCAVGAKQACDVSAEFSVQAPDGTVTPGGRGIVWPRPPLGPRILMLGQASMTVGFAKDDAPGTYQLVALVTDHVARKTLRLTSAFELAPPPRP
jgi:hypothetical protein